MCVWTTARVLLCVQLLHSVGQSVPSPLSTCAEGTNTCGSDLERKLGTRECKWQPQVRLSSSSQRRHPHGLCWASETHKYVYINIAKVASTSLKQLVGQKLGGRAQQSKCEFDPTTGRLVAFRPHVGRGEYGTAVDASGYFVFAFVRSPLRRFLSGFHTVAKRGSAGGAYGDSKRMPFVRVTHDDRAQMEAFFADVETNGGPWEEHTAQQSFYLSHPNSHVPLHLDFVGRVEDFHVDWRKVEFLANLQSARTLPKRNPEERSKVPNPVTLEQLEVDAEMLRKICKLYEQDFLCLNYTVPQQCNS